MASAVKKKKPTKKKKAIKKTIAKKSINPKPQPQQPWRPLAYETPEEMERQINDYFITSSERMRDHVTMVGAIVKVKDPAPVHITGLCVHLGITNETLNQYQKKPGFSEPITRAKLKCEAHAVDACFEGKKGNKADFVLSNNFRQNWSHRTKTELTGEDGGAIKTENKNLSDNELNARILELAAKGGKGRVT